jgi:hypothetical protein
LGITNLQVLFVKQEYCKMVLNLSRYEIPMSR